MREFANQKRKKTEIANNNHKPSYPKGDAIKLNRYRRSFDGSTESVPWSRGSFFLDDSQQKYALNPLNLSGHYRVVESPKMLLDSILDVCYPHTKPLLALLPKASEANLTCVLSEHIDDIGAMIVNHPDEQEAQNIADFVSAWGMNSVCVTSQDVTDFECDINLFDLIILDESEYNQSNTPINALWHALKPGGLFIYIEQCDTEKQTSFMKEKVTKEQAHFQDMSDIALDHPAVEIFEDRISIVNENGCRTQFSVVEKMEATITDKTPDIAQPYILPVDGNSETLPINAFLQGHHLHFGIFREDKIVSMTELVSHISTGAAHWKIIQPGVVILNGNENDWVPSFDIALHPYFDDAHTEKVELTNQPLKEYIVNNTLPVSEDGIYTLKWKDQNIGLLAVQNGQMVNKLPDRWISAADKLTFEIPFLENQ